MSIQRVDASATDAPIRFDRSLRETGFAVIVGHPVEHGLITHIYEEWLRFFATDAKHRYTAADGSPDGYFPYQPEPVGDRLVRDRKEFFHVYRWGRYPVEVSDAALRYLRDAGALARRLLGWIDECGPSDVTSRLSTPLAQMTDLNASVLRVQHYLPLWGDEPPDAPRALAHTDINLLTVLPAPNGPGLQLRDAGGTWRDVASEPGSLIINTGEMLQLASGGQYPATPHRVMKPAGTGAGGSRMSLPLFVHPADPVELAPGRTAAVFRAARVAKLRRQGWNVVAGGGDNRPGGA
jgi:isopenicillin N synthase-like dioxygenase